MIKSEKKFVKMANRLTVQEILHNSVEGAIKSSNGYQLAGEC